MDEIKNFTPGPWGLENTKEMIWVGPLRPDGKIDKFVASFDYGKEYNQAYRDRQLANATLIASAPALQSEVISLRKEVKELIEENEALKSNLYSKED